MYIAKMPYGSPPSRQGPQLEASFEVLVLPRPKARSAADPMPEDGMKPLAASHLDSYSRVFIHHFSFVSECFINVRIFSRRVWIKELSRFQSINVFRIFSCQIQASRIPGKAALCLQQTTNLADRCCRVTP